jgi:predicted RNase H-like nuclease (RuvC/YqgF family)
MKKTWVVVVAAGVALAQGTPKSVPSTAARDAGVAPSKNSPDAGVVASEPLRVPGTASTGDLDRLRKDVIELRAKVSELEQKATKAEALASDVEKLRQQLDTLKARVDEDEERRLSEERELARKKATFAQATNTLQTVLTQLQTGNTANVDAWLRTVEGQLAGNASRLVSLARQSLATQDLAATRTYLGLAMMEPPTP